MYEHLTETLYKNFPNLYQSRPDFECLSGWYDIIYRLSERITKIIEEDETLDVETTQVWQVKEKFAKLIFRMNRYNDKILAAIDEAQRESLGTCEQCGNEGVLRKDLGCLQIACLECVYEVQKKLYRDRANV